MLTENYSSDSEESEVNYMLPWDEIENLHELHVGFKILRNGNYIAPITQQLEDGIEVLDSGCGINASWALEMAKSFPNSNFFGVDVSDFDVAKLEIPTNARLSKGDICKSISALDNTFDFVFQRLLIATFTNDQWNSNLKELYRVTKPGGFIELLEHNPEPFNAGPLFTKLSKQLNAVLESADYLPNISTELNGRLQQVGFTNCVTVPQVYPINHGENGAFYWNASRGAYRGMATSFVKLFPALWEEEQVQEMFLDAVGKEAAEKRSYFKFYTTYAQKPY
ncbi:S-adenosyl-L-methionine-dependent methyltransferase [Pilaira anomala]|nr:S-adenosyl-L-methionine-dependent methyltransferase [Pilaira anomala]